MEDYTPNSHRFREEQKASGEREKMQKIVKGTVKTKKKSEMVKFKDVFISEDAATVKSYLLMDVLLPALKNTIEDVVTNGIRMILRGETSSRSRSTADKVSYNRYYDRRDDRGSSSKTTRSGYSYDDLFFDSRGEADAVLSRLDEAIEQYGLISVADMYDLAGITPSHTDYNYGWSNIRNAEIRRTRDGYILDMPKALPISNMK